MFCLVLHWPPYGSHDIFDDSKGNLIFVTNMEKTVGRVTFRLLSSAYLMALKVIIYMCILSVKQNEENQNKSFPAILFGSFTLPFQLMKHFNFYSYFHF